MRSLLETPPRMRAKGASDGERRREINVPGIFALILIGIVLVTLIITELDSRRGGSDGQRRDRARTRNRGDGPAYD